ncbi:IucA/IucC family protein [Microlunatus soli]|uniref:Siderophore synthetase component n=1 Tax=Microlunatus soli TaxID=630515 RepID=A0A1H1Q4W3_9ACTN|nr:IucA/IucC family siderophore biosynthesis protein [Microlunatus soli]SDS18542.1 Siderophore synthetase component [Microlunatus soli]
MSTTTLPRSHAGSFAATEPSDATGQSAVAHLNPRTAEVCHRHLTAKAIAEFSHERLIVPHREAATPDGGHRYRLSIAGSRAEYTFTARLLPLEHWLIDPGSLARTVDGDESTPDVLELIRELAPTLGIPDSLLRTYLEEISSTLAAAMYKATHQRLTAAELVDADFQQIEAAMTEGHPAFVANNGRIGFGVGDYAAYAPETGRPVRIQWLAVRRAASHFAAMDGIDEDELYRAEVGAATLARFADRLRSLGLEPDDYRYLPVHPWQWENKITVTFAADLARRDLVYLEPSAARYQPQQSIRTLFNLDDPDRAYVKMPLAIQNMGFLRGLSPRYMRDTPAINAWVAGVVSADPELGGRGFGVLCEAASIGYTGSSYERIDGSAPQQKMVAALWRESPMPRVRTDERLSTMAAVLHRDRSGRPLVGELITASGRSADDWLGAFLRAYLRPIVHSLLVHRLVFMPHGENLIMVLKDHVPARMFIKDIGEEVAVLDDQPLPDAAQRIRAEVPEEMIMLSIHTDVFDGFLRYLAAILDDAAVLSAERFWQLVADCLNDYAEDHPEQEQQVRELFAGQFAHSCLNRLQLRNTLRMVDLGDQAGSLQFAGSLDNPIAGRRRTPARR